MASTRSKIGAATVVLFVLFGDRILSWYIGLPAWVTWSGAGAIGLIMLGFLYFVRNYPNKIRPHRNAIQKVVGDIRFSLFAFIFTGMSDVFYNLDRSLFSFYMYPGPWIVLGFQAVFLLNIAGLEYDELDFGGQLASFVWTHSLSSIWQFRSGPKRLVSTSQESRPMMRIERVVAFVASVTYLVVTICPLLLNVPSVISAWMPATPLVQSDVLLFGSGPLVAWMFTASFSPRGGRKTTFVAFYTLFLIGFLTTLAFQLYSGQLR